MRSILPPLFAPVTTLRSHCARIPSPALAYALASRPCCARCACCARLLPHPIQSESKRKRAQGEKPPNLGVWGFAFPHPCAQCARMRSQCARIASASKRNFPTTQPPPAPKHQQTLSTLSPRLKQFMVVPHKSVDILMSFPHYIVMVATRSTTKENQHD